MVKEWSPKPKVVFHVQDQSLKLYNHGGGLFPSVTEVLKVIANPGFEKWKKMPGSEERLFNAASLGTRVHAMASDVARGRKVKLTDELEPFYIAIQGFLEEHVEKVLQTEKELVSTKLKLGGTLDLYAVMKDGRKAVIDYKTTASLTRVHGLQTAGYALLLRDNSYKVKRRMCVRIKKEKPGSFAVREYEEHWSDVNAFLNILHFWHWWYGPTLAKRAKPMGGIQSMPGTWTRGRRYGWGTSA